MPAHPPPSFIGLIVHLILAGILLGRATFSDATAALLSEACHQLVDASPHVAVMQSVWVTTWQRLAKKHDLLAFGPARLSLLIRLAVLVCATGLSFIVLLEALTSLPAANFDAVPHMPWMAAVLSAVAAEAVRDHGSDSAPNHRTGMRVSTLIAAASIGRTSQLYVTPLVPPLMQMVLNIALRSPDASAGLVLSSLAAARGVAEAAAPAQMLLQTAPHEVLPDLNRRLAQACAIPGVTDVRDVQLWALDESRAVGSLVVIVRADAHTQVVLRHVHRAFDEAPLSLTVQIERDDDEPWGDGAEDVDDRFITI